MIAEADALALGAAGAGEHEVARIARLDRAVGTRPPGERKRLVTAVRTGFANVRPAAVRRYNR